MLRIILCVISYFIYVVAHTVGAICAPFFWHERKEISGLADDIISDWHTWRYERAMAKRRKNIKKVA